MDDDDIDTDNITLGPQYKLLVLNLPVIVTAIKVLLLLLLLSLLLYYNNYDMKIYVFAPINRRFQKNPKCFNLTGRKIKY